MIFYRRYNRILIYDLEISNSPLSYQSTEGTLYYNSRGVGFVLTHSSLLIHNDRGLHTSYERLV